MQTMQSEARLPISDTILPTWREMNPATTLAKMIVLADARYPGWLDSICSLEALCDAPVIFRGTPAMIEQGPSVCIFFFLKGPRVQIDAFNGLFIFIFFLFFCNRILTFRAKKQNS